MNRTAIVTGVTGQDGSWLSELLLDKDYTVYGLKRRNSTNNLWRIKDCLKNKNFILEEGDIIDPCFMSNFIRRVGADELYNLAAMSHVGESFKQPSYTFDVNFKGVLYILEAIKEYSPHTRVYHAGSSEEFGSNYTEEKDGKRFQDENTPLSSNSPYGLSKIASRSLINLYRKSYGIWCCAGYLFNHETSRRGEEFVTRKITKWLGEFKLALSKHYSQDYNFEPFLSNVYKLLDFKREEQYIVGPHNFVYPKLSLGNIKSYRDWSDARDMVRGMWMMLQRDEPEDFVLGSGETRSVEDFCRISFSSALQVDNWEDYIYINPEFFRPCEVEYLRANPYRANNVLGWKPMISFDEMVNEMVKADLKAAESDRKGVGQ